MLLWSALHITFLASSERVNIEYYSCLQCLAALGLILSHSITSDWLHYVQFTLLLVGTFASRCFTAVIALMLLAVQCDRLCLALRIKPLMYFYGIGYVG